MAPSIRSLRKAAKMLGDNHRFFIRTDKPLAPGDHEVDHIISTETKIVAKLKPPAK